MEAGRSQRARAPHRHPPLRIQLWRLSGPHAVGGGCRARRRLQVPRLRIGGPARPIRVQAQTLRAPIKAYFLERVARQVRWGIKGCGRVLCVAAESKRADSKQESRRHFASGEAVFAAATRYLGALSGSKGSQRTRHGVRSGAALRPADECGQLRDGFRRGCETLSAGPASTQTHTLEVPAQVQPIVPANLVAQS